MRNPSQVAKLLACTVIAFAFSGCGKSAPSAPSAPPAAPGSASMSISPTSGVRGTTVAVTFTGSNFVGGSDIYSTGGLAQTGVTVVNSTTITANVVIDPHAALGTVHLGVANGAELSAWVPFTVLPPAPTLASVSPNFGAQGSTVLVTLTGGNFVTGATTVAVGGTGTSSSNVSAGDTSAVAYILIAPTAALGTHAVSVTTAGGTTLSVPFTVNAPTP